MNEVEEMKLEEFKKKLVSNARAILSNSIGLPIGIIKMNKIISWIEGISKNKSVEFQHFKTLNSSISHFPLCVERLQCDLNFQIQLKSRLP